MQNNPFDTGQHELISLSAGVTATDKYNINCDQAESVGHKIQETLNGLQFNCAKIKRNDQIRTLVCLQKPIKTNGETINIKPETLINRMTILVRNEEERTEYFQ